jgi:adenosylmethionine-8-amino-7-oxononanoate aminotransferase
MKKKSQVFYRGPLNKEYPVMVKGEGIYLFDEHGRRYIDAKGGIAVINVGYGVKEIVDAMSEQALTLNFLNTIQFTSPAQEALSERLAEFSPPGLNKTWLSLSGTEANETAIKLARQYHVETGNPGRYKLIGLWNGYHGNTLGSLSASGKTAWRKLYTPYLLDFPHIFPAYCYQCYFDREYPGCELICARELEKVVKQEGPESISAVIMEPLIAATAGVLMPPTEYFKIVRSICDRYGILLIADEVFTGMGRTGKNFAISHWDVIPDIITTAKGIAGGYMPLGATIVHDKVFDTICSGSGQFVHGITFSGHPVACAAGIATMDYLKKHDLVKRSERMGDYLIEKLTELKQFDFVGDIRGEGLLVGVEFVKDRNSRTPFERKSDLARTITGKAFERGLIVHPVFGGIDSVYGDCILLAPPFIIQEKEIDEIVGILAQTLGDIENILK